MERAYSDECYFFQCVSLACRKGETLSDLVSVTAFCPKGFQKKKNQKILELKEIASHF